MRVMARIVLAAGLCGLLAGCKTPGQGPVSLTHSSVLAKAGLETYWQLPLELPPGETIRRLILLEENLYCLTSGNTLLAIDAARGVRKWATQVALPGRKVFAPCHAAGVPITKEIPGVRKIVLPPAPETLTKFNLVLVNTPNYVVAYDRETGQEIRRIDFGVQPTDFTANTGGACDGTYYYVGSVVGRCYAYRLQESVLAWYLQTGDILSAAPRCHSPGGIDYVYVAGEDGEYYVIRAGDRMTQFWPPDTARPWAAMDGPVTAAFVVDDRACFIPCADRRVYAFPLAGGEAIWKFTCNGPLVNDIQVSENSVFQYARGDKLYALNPANGSERWSMPKGRRVLAAMPMAGSPTAFVLDSARNLLVVDEILGKVQAAMPLTGCQVFADNTAAPAIYAASRGGQIYCLRLKGAEPLTARQLTKARPIRRAPETRAATRPAPTGP